MAIRLADNYTVMGIARASVTDISTGKYIGTTTVGERDGALIAVEVHIFPENMRGTGEGHRDWDLRPDSKMTNASVANMVAMDKDRVMTVQYKGGEKKILVNDSTVVVSYAPVERSDVRRDVPVPTPPFWGERLVESLDLDEIYPFINTTALFRGQ